MCNLNQLDDIKRFFVDISHVNQSVYGGLFEIVIDFTSSKYFDPGTQLDDLVQYAIDQAKAGHQVFFGPANRNEDLGSNRSGVSNVFGFLSVWVDIDSPEKELPAEEQLAEAQKLLAAFKQKLNGYGITPSYIVESGHGYHVYFALKRFLQQPDASWQNVQNAIVKLAKGDPMVRQPASLLRVPGTFNCKDPQAAKPVKIIERSESRYEIGDFNLLLVDMVKEYEQKKNMVPSKIGKGKHGFTPPCITSLLDPSNKPPLGHRHQVRQIISTFAFHEGWPLEETKQKVLHTTDDPKKAERDIEGVYKVLERDPERYSVGCGQGSHLRALIDGGLATCDEKKCQFKQHGKEKDNGKQEVHSAWFDGLVEVVTDDSGDTRFLIKENESLIVKDKHVDTDCVYTPPPFKQIAWKAPRANEVMKYVTGDSDQQLFNDLVDYHRSISELPDDNYYCFLAAWDMHTYLIEKFEYSPIIWLYAIPARGKSRTAKGVTYVSWRGIILNTVKEQHIIRLATNDRATLFFDIMDLWKKVQRSDVADIMLNRFERGGKVARIMNPELGPFKDTVWFEIYGPTIIASNKTIDDILETRSIQIVMPETAKIFENDVKEINALPFRERLTAFRARWIDRQLPEVGKPVAGRLGDILRPIRQVVSVACSDESWFMDFAKYEEESKRKDGFETDEAKVVDAIVHALGKVENGHLIHKDTLDVLNTGLSDRYQMTPHRLGRITKRLGFKRYSSGDARGIYINEELLNRLCQRYGIQTNNGVLTV